MRILKLLTPLGLFVIVGIYGHFSKDFIEIYKSFYYWFIIPAFALGVYYAFSLTPKHEKNKNGPIALQRFAITIFITFLIYQSIQGYIVLYNCNLGKQIEKNVTGEVTEIMFPKDKLLFDKNSIKILLSDNNETITLEVPTRNYYAGQPFEKKMTLGSLGVLYSSK